jgi:hypothetical protein
MNRSEFRVLCLSGKMVSVDLWIVSCQSMNGHTSTWESVLLLEAMDGHSKKTSPQKKMCVECGYVVRDGQTDDTIQHKSHQNLLEGLRKNRK